MPENHSRLPRELCFQELQATPFRAGTELLNQFLEIIHLRTLPDWAMEASSL
jgi:hypothetical protein